MTKQVPYTCTRNVMTCVPCEEWVTCTRYVAKQVYRQVPVNNCCESYSCCSSGGHGHGHKMFSNFRGGFFGGGGHGGGHGHGGGCDSCGGGH